MCTKEEIFSVLKEKDLSVISVESSENLLSRVHYTGFIQVLVNLESPEILLWHFSGLESPEKRLLVQENSGNLSKSSKKHEMYGRYM